MLMSHANSELPMPLSSERTSRLCNADEDELIASGRKRMQNEHAI